MRNLLSQIAARTELRISESGLVGRVLAHARWSLFGAVGAKIVAALAMLLTARILGREAFGDYGVAQSSLALLASLSSLGVGATACRHIAVYRHSNPERASGSLSLAVLVAWGAATSAAALLLLSSAYICDHVIERPQLTRAFQIGAIAVFFQILNGAQTGVLSGLESFRHLAWLSLGSSGLRLAAMTIGASMGRVEGCLWGLALSNAAICVGYRAAAAPGLRRASLRFCYRAAVSEWRLIGQFSLPVVLCDFLILGSQWLAVVLLTRDTAGGHAVGAYTLGQQICSLILLVPGAISTTLLPVFSSALGAQGEDAARQLVIRMSIANVLVSVAAAVTALIAFPAVNALLNFQYGDSFTTIALMASAAVMVATAGTVGSYMQSKSHVWIGAAICSCQSTTLVAGAHFLSAYGAQGTALAYLASYAVHLALVIVYLRREKSERPTLTDSGAVPCTSSI